MEGVTSPLHRMTFLRGNRDYVVDMEGFTETAEAAVLERLIATAR